MTSELAVDDLVVRFPLRSAMVARLLGRTSEVLTAVDGLSFTVPPGESVAVVGESGCGKSTLARCLVGLQAPTAGRIRLGGQVLPRRRTRGDRRRIQMVFQDPSSSLNPTMTVATMLAELLHVHDLARGDQVRARVAELLELVQLPGRIAAAYPRDLSGGQRQRIGIARALALEPEVLVADEAVAALDASVQASVLNLFAELRARLGLTLIFISHDLAAVRHVADRVMVMYLGAVVEDRPAESLFTDPQHPYTQALLDAAPRLDRRLGDEPSLPGEPPSPVALPSGCRFHPRCIHAIDHCRETEPVLTGPSATDRTACHLAWRDTHERR
ncbi:ABC transporter ATP-binding protein [Phytoactinopolyspora limicola]|uniref:ABC transporter ATP-binding protein n=1 Tax=Phytoactinopolyspora limicola TaxID=2715536 RepID=UPI00140B6FC0|nr:ABC transporter ATP-binding protein [Phytoactinopolyspora limicola]